MLCGSVRSLWFLVVLAAASRKSLPGVDEAQSQDMQGTGTAAGCNRSGHASRTFDVQRASCSALLTEGDQMVPAPEHPHSQTHMPGWPRIQCSLVLVLVVWLDCSLNAS